MQAGGKANREGFETGTPRRRKKTRPAPQGLGEKNRRPAGYFLFGCSRSMDESARTATKTIATLTENPFRCFSVTVGYRGPHQATRLPAWNLAITEDCEKLQQLRIFCGHSEL